uniref:Uncharacterized protein n=1 Tax=Pithovirus LCPAC404 TaxID=2506597 RepID=A0A481ZER2_9VIRU|nr:MAG: hypothetical protein LCPAC404_02740 [Pithovirus LCPAC404]
MTQPRNRNDPPIDVDMFKADMTETKLGISNLSKLSKQLGRLWSLPAGDSFVDVHDETAEGKQGAFVDRFSNDDLRGLRTQLNHRLDVSTKDYNKTYGKYSKLAVKKERRRVGTGGAFRKPATINADMASFFSAVANTPDNFFSFVLDKLRYKFWEGTYQNKPVMPQMLTKMFTIYIGVNTLTLPSNRRIVEFGFDDPMVQSFRNTFEDESKNYEAVRNSYVDLLSRYGSDISGYHVTDANNVQKKKSEVDATDFIFRWIIKNNAGAITGGDLDAAGARDIDHALRSPKVMSKLRDVMRPRLRDPNTLNSYLSRDDLDEIAQSKYVFGPGPDGQSYDIQFFGGLQKIISPNINRSPVDNSGNPLVIAGQNQSDMSADETVLNAYTDAAREFKNRPATIKEYARKDENATIAMDDAVRDAALGAIGAA